MILHRCIECVFAVLRLAFHVIFSLVHWRKGKIVPPITNPLLLKSATKLAQEIRRGQLRSVDVIQAYIERIKEVEPYINATVDRRYSEALEEAREADAIVVSGRFTEGQLAEEKPLLGVPVSIKMILSVKGCQRTSGSILYKGTIATEDAASVALMKNAGAIVIATTNMPEFAMYLESLNKLYGKTSNPYDTNRTSGGSSGGESALISAAGSVIGIGNDLLGSVRLPGHFTGVFAHKPTMGMVPNEGTLPEADPGMEHFIGTGPMCRYAEDLATVMKVLTANHPTPVNFGQSVNFKDLKILYTTNIRSIAVSSVDKKIIDGLRNVVSYFETKYGYCLREVTLPLMYDACRCVIHNLVSPIKDPKTLIFSSKGSHLNEKWEFFKLLFGRSTLSLGPIMTINFLSFPLWYNIKDAQYYQELLKNISEAFESMLDDNTVLLLPTYPTTAPYHYEFLPSIPNIIYTGIFNFTGFPSTQCPIGFDRHGLPYGIQIVGSKGNDALTVALAVELQKVFGGWVPPTSVLLNN